MTFFKGRRISVVILSSLTLGLGFLNWTDRLNWKLPSDGIVWVQTQRGVEVKAIMDSTTLETQKELKPGDLLLEINGISIKTLDEHTEVVEILSETLPGNTSASYLIRLAKTKEETSYPVRIQRRSQIGRSDLFLVLVGFTYLVIGLFIFLRHRNAKGVFHFYLICVVAFVLFLFRHSGRADVFDIFIYWCDVVAFLLLPPLFLHFSYSFPKGLARSQSVLRLNFLTYLPFFVLFGLQLSWFWGQLKPLGLARSRSGESVLEWLQMIHFVSFFLLAACILVFVRRGASTLVQRQQMKWITNGALIGVVPFALLYGVPYLLGWSIYASMEFSILSLALIPLAFGYAITKYRLMDVELIFKKGAAYLLATSTLLGFYILVAILAGRAAERLFSESGFVLFGFSALIVALLFAPLKNRIQEQIDRYFYKNQYNYRQSFAEFGQTLGSEISLPRLAEQVSNRIRQTLNLDPVTLFLRTDTQSHTYRLYHISQGVRNAVEPTSLEISLRVFSDLAQQPRPLSLSQEIQAGCEDTLSRWGIHYIQPLLVRDRVIGFLGLGQRANGALMNSEDLDLMATLSRYVAIAVDNALLYSSLRANASKLERLKLYSENVIQSITVGVVVIAPEGEITIWNPSMESIYGLPQGKAVGRNLADILPSELIQTMKEVLEGPNWLIQENIKLCKIHLKVEEGHTRLVDITLVPFVLHDDVNTGTLLIFDDITEKIRLEGQLQQAEKLSSIGLFVAGVAHEVNTPLAGISSYAQMLLKKSSPRDPHYSILRKIEKQSFRASNIVTNLLNFARCSDADLQEVNINSLMMETLSLINHQFRRNGVDLQLDLDPSLPKTVGSGGKLQQVFMNLFLNAKDAMAKGGRLRVKTYAKDSSLIVEIEDNGVGIAEEHIKQIYDPFFTTKEVGRGTGLGLSISYGIIQEHSGRISVESASSRGTTFTLRLPVTRVN